MEFNRKIDIYVMPRKVSEEQVTDLRGLLAGHEAQSVTIKVDAQDRETTDYWGQTSMLFALLHGESNKILLSENLIH